MQIIITADIAQVLLDRIKRRYADALASVAPYRRAVRTGAFSDTRTYAPYVRVERKSV